MIAATSTSSARWRSGLLERGQGSLRPACVQAGAAVDAAPGAQHSVQGAPREYRRWRFTGALPESPTCHWGVPSVAQGMLGVGRPVRCRRQTSNMSASVMGALLAFGASHREWLATRSI
jgi:hypothetical protein